MDSIIYLISIFALSMATIDVKLADDGCATYDTCSMNDFFRTCSCKDDCHLYDTCCLDSPAFGSKTESEYSCHVEKTVTPVFAKRKCAEDFNGGHDVISSCQDGDRDKAQLVRNLLVSSNLSSTTYWNWNCGICNHEEPQNLLFWSVQVTCPDDGDVNQELIRDKLTYKKLRDSWGLDKNGVFTECSLNFMQPGTMIGKLKYCAPNLVSNCPSDFKDQDTIDKCGYYYGERKQRGNVIVYFKNAHCALCNGIAIKDLECFGRNYRPLGLTSDENSIKVLFKSGMWVGSGAERYKCLGRNMAFNPFYQKCMSFKRPVYEPLNGGRSSMQPRLYLTVFTIMLLFLYK